VVVAALADLGGMKTQDATVQCAVGEGRAVGHHGEVLQGAFRDRIKGIRRMLVTLPCEMFQSSARFHLRPTGVLEVEPTWKVKAKHAAALTLARFAHAGCSGRLELSGGPPIGLGFGSSTSDVVATIRAVADALGVTVHPWEVADLAVAVETASDSTMFGDRAVLFAQRCGEVVEDLGGTLPPVVVVGFNSDPNGHGVDTLTHRADYSALEIESFRPLLGLLRHAVRHQDPRLLGRVATASARINERFLPKFRFREVVALAEASGAVGVQVAHSGTLVGLMFDAADRSVIARLERCERDLSQLGISPTWRFLTGEPMRYCDAS
jgi:uncharacterized protein involved in propanediol utilization